MPLELQQLRSQEVQEALQELKKKLEVSIAAGEGPVIIDGVPDPSIRMKTAAEEKYKQLEKQLDNVRKLLDAGITLENVKAIIKENAKDLDKLARELFDMEKPGDKKHSEKLLGFLHSDVLSSDLEFVQIKADGSCLYNAFYYGIHGELPGKTEVKALRETIASHMEERENKSYFSRFLDEGEEINSYIKDVREGAYGDQMVMRAMEKLFNKRIVIVAADGKINPIDEREEGTVGDPILVYFHGGHPGHYDFLKPKYGVDVESLLVGLARDLPANHTSVTQTTVAISSPSAGSIPAGSAESEGSATKRARPRNVGFKEDVVKIQASAAQASTVPVSSATPPPAVDLDDPRLHARKDWDEILNRARAASPGSEGLTSGASGAAVLKIIPGPSVEQKPPESLQNNSNVANSVGTPPKQPAVPTTQSQQTLSSLVPASGMKKRTRLPRAAISKIRSRFGRTLKRSLASLSPKKDPQASALQNKKSLESKIPPPSVRPKSKLPIKNRIKKPSPLASFFGLRKRLSQLRSLFPAGSSKPFPTSGELTGAAQTEKNTESSELRSAQYELDVDKFRHALDVDGVQEALLFLKERTNNRDFSSIGDSSAKIKEMLQIFDRLSYKNKTPSLDDVNRLHKLMISDKASIEQGGIFREFFSANFLNPSDSQEKKELLLYEFNHSVLAAITEVGAAPTPSTTQPPQNTGDLENAGGEPISEELAAHLNALRDDEKDSNPEGTLQAVKKEAPFTPGYIGRLHKLAEKTKKEFSIALTEEEVLKHFNKQVKKVEDMKKLSKEDFSQDPDAFIKKVKEVLPERMKAWEGNKDDIEVLNNHLLHKSNTAQLYKDFGAHVQGDNNPDAATIDLLIEKPKKDGTGNEIFIKESFHKTSGAINIELSSKEDADLLQTVELTLKALQISPVGSRVEITDPSPERGMKIYLFAMAAGGEGKFIFEAKTEQAVDAYADTASIDAADQKQNKLAQLYKAIKPAEGDSPLTPEQIRERLNDAEEANSETKHARP